MFCCDSELVASGLFKNHILTDKLFEFKRLRQWLVHHPNEPMR